MKRTLLLTLICCLISKMLCAQFDVDDYKARSNAEIVNTLKAAVAQISSIEHFSEAFLKDDDQQIYTKDELLPAFRLDTVKTLQLFKELLGTRLTLVQSFTGDGSKLKVDDGNLHQKLSGETYSISLVPEKVYFYDGTTATGNVENITLDFSFPEKIPFRKRIDSIACKVRLSYVSALDKVEVNTQKKESIYKGKFIKILKTDKNDIEYIFHRDLDFAFVEGLNASGKVIDDKNYSTRDYRQKDFNIFSTLKRSFEAIITAAEKDTSLAAESFQKKYLSRIETEISKIPHSDTMHTTAKYKGAINGLRAYIVTGRKEQTASLMLRCATFEDIHFDYDSEEHASFKDNEGNTILETKETLTPVNQYFYEGNQSFLYFNPATRQFEKLPYYSVKKVTGNYVEAREDEQSGFLLLNRKNEKVGEFDRIGAYENTVVARKGSTALVIAPDDRQVWFKDLGQLSEMYNGYAFIQMNGKYGFMDQYGKLSVPAEYDGAMPFGEMDSYTADDLLFGVKKGNKWGFVNVHNKTIIPFDYEEVLPFSYGITMVVKETNRGLINTKNEVIAPFTGGGSYGLSTNFGKRFYSLGSGNYNHLGKKEKKEDR